MGILECDPNAIVVTPECIPDAGADADASDDAPDAEIQAECTGRCVPEPDDISAGDWPRTPLLLYVGPKGQVPTSCPDTTPNDGVDKDVLFMKYRRFMHIDAPPATCQCTCPPSEGTCTELPETIEIRAGTCAENGAPALPFGGPVGWDGSCTSANALPAGADCGGEPCAQSVWSSPLPGPTSEACPVTTVPAAVATAPATWLTEGIACEAKELEGACDPSTYRCARDLPLPWLLCVSRSGEHQCPGNYKYARFVMYGEEPLDERGCRACECGGEPEGSACLATLRLYSDATCGDEADKVGVSSFGDQCVNVHPPGRALGSKAITNLAYTPGTCSATGGEPTGNARGAPGEAVTFCCLEPFYLPPR
ncbi:hypothetical protein [Polyangium fumosum]|uniref:Uncharacterized protein n=1 Tax=Polyangium fumosum TaxID=889272 RepID=A0A4U1JED5_9BACT|nr:hypothetical protein [Polyangium fumosum]TKD09148.1 hypothetical protein E8A74_12745 [Polyangium fumosum]